MLRLLVASIIIILAAVAIFVGLVVNAPEAQPLIIDAGGLSDSKRIRMRSGALPCNSTRWLSQPPAISLPQIELVAANSFTFTELCFDPRINFFF